jgi:thiamine biosynthesis protein ThiI
MSLKGISSKNIEETITLMQKVPGFNLIIPAYACDHDFSFLKEQIIKKLKSDKISGTFKVDTKRSYKQYHLNSMEVSRLVGETILDKCKTLKVDIHKPDTTITIEIKEKRAIFYFKKIKGRGGFPLGINGRVLLLMSGGIDSPVAANLLLKKGLHVDFLTFISPPHTDEQALNKVKTLKKIISLDNHLYKSNLYVVNFTNVQHEITHISNHSYQITLMRRFFFRFAKEIAITYNYGANATGESLGQVASQTLESITTIQNAIGDFTTLRPLLTYDKEEIIQLAKQ